jgi:hypothetical protein
MSVENLYLKYIQQLSIPERLDLIRMLINSTFPALTKKPAQKKSKGPMEFAGAGKAYAMKKDAQAHIRQLRSEWD